jgi:hypothetical protein
VATTSNITAPTNNNTAASAVLVPPPTPSNNTAPVLVPPPTPGASTAAVVPSTPAAAPSTPEWKTAMNSVAKGLDTIAKMAVEERKERKLREEEERKQREERDAKADEKFDKLASSAIQANEKGDYAIKLGEHAVGQSNFAVKQSNFAVKQVERFEARLQTEVAASVRKEMDNRLNMQHEEEDDDEEEEDNNAKREEEEENDDNAKQLFKDDVMPAEVRNNKDEYKPIDKNSENKHLTEGKYNRSDLCVMTLLSTVTLTVSFLLYSLS